MASRRSAPYNAAVRWTTPTPHGELVVDEARPEDARPLLALRAGVLAEEQWFITEPQEFSSSVDQKMRKVLDLQRAPNSVFLVARRGGRVVGLLTIQGGQLRRMRHAGKLEIMVHRDCRGQGVGRALMRAAVRWAVDNPEVTKLGLNVFADNERAIALYRQFGFAEEGRRLREYRMKDGTYRDDVLMYRFVDGEE